MYILLYVSSLFIRKKYGFFQYCFVYLGFISDRLRELIPLRSPFRNKKPLKYIRAADEITFLNWYTKCLPKKDLTVL